MAILETEFVFMIQCGGQRLACLGISAQLINAPTNISAHDLARKRRTIRIERYECVCLPPAGN